MSDVEKKKRKPFSKNGFFAAGAILVLLIVGMTWMNHGKEFTDDAFIEAHIMPISPEISERVLKVYVNDNQMIQKGDLLVELAPRNNQAQAQLITADVDLA